MSVHNDHSRRITASDLLPGTSELLPGTLRVDVPSGGAHVPRTKKAFLTVIRGRADLGAHTVVEGRAVVGRDPACEMPLMDHRVSRRHAVFLPTGEGRFLLQDLGSTNGTSVGGVPIAGPHVLSDGDKIQLGETVIRFSLADEIDVDFQSEIATLVGQDPLTGLPSKRRFDDALEFALHAAKRGRGTVAILMMDMDGVKQINDTHGHLFGAHVIGETGRLIAQVIGAKGRACRFGGDEFSAFLPGHDLTAAADVAQRIRVAVESAGMAKDGIPLRPTISIGVTSYPESGDELADLIARSDEALYRAKAKGKNCVSS